MSNPVGPFYTYEVGLRAIAGRSQIYPTPMPS
jgi:hypothetical protein